MNGEYVKKIPQPEFKALLKSKIKCGVEAEEWWDYLVAQVQPRTKFLNDLDTSCTYLATDDFPFDEKAVEKRLKKEGAKKALEDVIALFDPIAESEWLAPKLEEIVKGLSQGQGMGPWVHPIRVAVSGRGEGIGLFEMLQLLGREKTLARLRRAAAELCG